MSDSKSHPLCIESGHCLHELLAKGPTSVVMAHVGGALLVTISQIPPPVSPNWNTLGIFRMKDRRILYLRQLNQ